MREPYDFIPWVLVAIGIGVGIGLLNQMAGDAESLEQRKQAQVDSIYESLVGADSLSVLSTVKRINAKLDSICLIHYEGRC